MSSFLVSILLLTITNSQVTFWTETMDTASLPVDWIETGTRPLSFLPTGGSPDCPLGASYCWDFSRDSIIATTLNPIQTSDHTNIALSYNVHINPKPPTAVGSCIVEYSTDNGTNYSNINTYTAITDTTESYTSFNPSADANPNGLSLRIRSLDINSKLDCYFNDFSLSGILLTSAPSKQPTTSPNTAAPTTVAPTSSPSTAAPTVVTSDPSKSPTSSPNTNAPTLSPTTAAPTSSPNTDAPTLAPTTAAPTSSPSTTAPSTAAPTSSPSTAAPTSSPSTATPTSSPNTIAPTTPIITSNTASAYFIDAYRSLDTAITGNTPPQSDYNQVYTPPDDYPYIAFPFNLCAMEGDDPSYAVHVKWQCSESGVLANRCSYNTESECEAFDCTDASSWGYDGFYDSSLRTVTLGYAWNDCNNGGMMSTTTNYLEVKWYKGYHNNSAGCPGNLFNATTYRGFEHDGTDRFATGICVRQDTDQYISAQCNSNGEGDIGVYNDAACTDLDFTMAQYGTRCKKVNLDYGFGEIQYYRRITGCYLNGVNVIRTTDPPTAEPTMDPITTVNPTGSPTETPTTGVPTSTPSANPTLEPTTTGTPTQTPSKAPVTPRPSAAPVPFGYTSAPTPSPTPSPTSRGERLIDDVKGASLVQFIIAALVIMYLFIGCCILCHERAKRFAILNPSDNVRKKQFAEAKARKLRQMELQSMTKGRQAVNSISMVEGTEGKRANASSI